MKNVITADTVLLMDDILNNGRIKFSDICNKLNIPIPKSQNSKKSILNQLKQFCNITEIKEPNKKPTYLITEIYTNPLLDEIHKNNKFQPYIEQAVLELILNNPNEKILYLSNSAILEATYMVNNNFKIACSSAVEKLNERAWIKNEANTIYSILYRWIRNRLKQMDARHLIQLQKGYRLYKTLTNENGEKYIVYKNVAKGSVEDEMCQSIMAQAIQKTITIPKDWDGGWLYPSVYEELKKNANLLCKNVFAEEGWEKINVVNAIIPVQNLKLIQHRLKDVAKILNNESQRKINNTSRLNHLTGYQRLQLTDEIISLNPTIDYKKILKEEKEKRDKV